MHSNTNTNNKLQIQTRAKNTKHSQQNSKHAQQIQNTENKIQKHYKIQDTINKKHIKIESTKQNTTLYVTTVKCTLCNQNHLPILLSLSRVFAIINSIWAQESQSL